MEALCVVGLAASFCVLLGLNVSDWCAASAAERSISRMTSLYLEDDEERERCGRQARLYNELLAGAEVEGAVLSYDQQLSYKREPMMAYIEVPKLALKLPIYHGTEENALMAGVGHLEGTALPVGGEGTRCVLMGHSGMRNARMFDGLERLGAGDELVVWTLGEPYAYRVVGAETVEPSEVEARIAPEEGRDLLTLVTCTPYGVNSHRLLVHAQRCPYDRDAPRAPEARAYVDGRSVPLALTCACAACFLLAARTRTARRSAAQRAGTGKHAARQRSAQRAGIGRRSPRRRAADPSIKNRYRRNGGGKE